MEDGFQIRGIKNTYIVNKQSAGGKPILDLENINRAQLNIKNESTDR